MKNNLWKKLMAGVAAAFVFAGVSAFAQTADEVTVILPNGTLVKLTAAQVQTALAAAAPSVANAGETLVNSQAFLTATPQVKAALAAFTAFSLTDGRKSQINSIATAVVQNLSGNTDGQVEVARSLSNIPGVNRTVLAVAVRVAFKTAGKDLNAVTAAVMAPGYQTTQLFFTAPSTLTPAATSTAIMVQQATQTGQSPF